MTPQSDYEGDKEGVRARPSATGPTRGYAAPEARSGLRPSGNDPARGASLPRLPLITTVVRRPDPEAWPTSVRDEMERIWNDG
jgi:hypothetical protein